MTDHEEVEARIARYTQELRAEATIAEGDLAELEDHLRCVTAELRDTGLPAATAVTEAARRLGDPVELAREHARVRSPFGARLSRVRAWSAAALILPFVAYYTWIGLHRMATVPLLVESALGVIVVGALALRLTWARAFLVGSLAEILVHNLPYFAVMGMERMHLAQMVAYAGALVFIAPRRKSELSGAGAGLALLGIAYGGCATLLGLQMTNASGETFGAGLALAALALLLAGALGGLVRARLGAVLAIGAGLTLAVSASYLWDLHVRVSHGDVIRATILASLLVGAASATAAGILGWRAARGALGTLRGVIA